MSNTIGPGDPTEPHGIPKVTPDAADTTKEQPVVDPTQAMPTTADASTQLQQPVATPAYLPPPPLTDPGNPYDDGSKRSIVGWVIGGVILAALLGLVGGAIWAAVSKPQPTPAPSISTTSSTPTPTQSTYSPPPTPTPTPTPTKTTPLPTLTAQPTAPPVQTGGPVQPPANPNAPVGEAPAE